MTTVKEVVKAGVTVLTIIGNMVVKGKGAMGKGGYVGQIKKK